MNHRPDDVSPEEHEARIAELRARRRARMRTLAVRSAFASLALTLLLAVALYPVRQLVVQRWLLRLPPDKAGNQLDRAIAQHRDLRVAVVEALAYMAVALWATGIA